MKRPAQRRELAVKAVAMKGVSIALACRAFDVSETCYRYSPKLDDENEQIADLRLGLTTAKKTWGFGLCFLYLRKVQGHGCNTSASTHWLAGDCKASCREADLPRAGVEPADQAARAFAAGKAGRIGRA